MKKFSRALTPILLAFAIYITYTGSIRLYDVVTGGIVAIAVGMAMASLIVEDWRKSLDIRRLAQLLIYTVKYFLIYEVKAHLNVIKLGLSPSIPVKPGIVRVPIESRSGYGITMVSVAITNTPGTVVIDLDEERGILYVHWIYVKSLELDEIYRCVAQEFDRYAKKVFG